jgi:cardiolipin synthase
LLVAFLAGASGCTIVSNVVSSEKRNVYHFDHPFGVSDPAFRRSMDTFGTAAVDGNRAEILNNGDQIFPAMLRAIREARLSIDFESYIFKDDRTGKVFAEALIDAARRGVEVRLLVDGSGGRAGSLLGAMQNAGVKAKVYRPIRLWAIYKMGRRTHRKILVVDGATCFTGGMGIDDRWQGDARNPNEWRDIAVRVDGPVAAQMQAVFSEDWTYTTGEILAGEKFYPRVEHAGDVDAQAVKSSRGDSSSLAKMLYYVAIQTADKSIHIQNAYFLPDRQVRDALIAAVKRGVDVRVIVPGKHIDIPLVRMASRLHYGDLLRGGVKIYEYRGTMLHSKTAVVDGVFSVVGSINFDARSLLTNAEESLAFYDRGFAARLENTFTADLAHCHEVVYERWRKRGLVQRFTELFSWLWEPLY